MITAKPYLREVELRPDPAIDWDAYPFSIPAVRDIEQIEFHADVTLFVGENGSGKSTVLEALAVALELPAEGGSRNVNRSDQQAVSALQRALLLNRSYKRPRSMYFLRAESLFNVFTYLDSIAADGAPPGPSMHEASHGEAFLNVLQGFRGDGLYLLDEPEAALSPARQLAALRIMHQAARDGCQFIVATHSPILLAYPGARIFLFDGSGISETRYEDTEHYAITHDFLNHYPRRLEQLLADDEG
ncbi:AAA family ATPase [Massilia arenosa]|uniref:AAA family ATPase n=1 Tax=Zemynaea arenosa TaxID=2561931 RepID=A0A4Y9SPK7_9BURK|nr:AAA family ATPase [Massilia arenosa]TFW27174.1 AAA family ATPase [Massilia arenosa]